VILLFGIPSEPPLELLHRRLGDRGLPVLILNQRDFESASLLARVSEAGIEGRLVVGDRSVDLGRITGIYARPMDDRLLPELDGDPPSSPRRLMCRALHDGIVAWLDVAPGRVVNRFREMGSNGSKPYQAQLISRTGFDVPETIVTNDPARVHEFRRRHRRVVYKSVSAARSVVQELLDTDLQRLESVRACPVQFQEFVPGFDVRVHAVGGQAIATRVDSPAVDYRYGEHGDGGTRLAAFELPADVAERCVDLTARLGLSFSGIDLRFVPGGRVVCFEVNPSPAYSYYEEHTGQPISAVLADYLAGALP
jgi:hypothetical protein